MDSRIHPDFPGQTRPHALTEIAGIVGGLLHFARMARRPIIPRFDARHPIIQV
jgi:hypothetical protein